MKIEEIESVIEEKKDIIVPVVSEEKVVEEKKDEKLEPIENGYEFDNYKWVQNAKDVAIFIPISSDTKSRNIKVNFLTNKIHISVKEQVFFTTSNELTHEIKPDNCTWFIDDDERGKRLLIVELDKKKFDEWWVCVNKGDPEIDASKIRPPNAQISDLDSSTRATIDKMMYDEDVKQKNGFYKDRV